MIDKLVFLYRYQLRHFPFSYNCTCSKQRPLGFWMSQQKAKFSPQHTSSPATHTRLHRYMPRSDPLVGRQNTQTCASTQGWGSIWRMKDEIKNLKIQSNENRSPLSTPAVQNHRWSSEEDWGGSHVTIIDISSPESCQLFGAEHSCRRMESQVGKKRNTLPYLMYIKKAKKKCLVCPHEQEV